MHDKADDFAPFVEDDQTLDTYLARMKREGVWAGHMELQVGGGGGVKGSPRSRDGGPQTRHAHNVGSIQHCLACQCAQLHHPHMLTVERFLTTLLCKPYHTIPCRAMYGGLNA